MDDENAIRAYSFVKKWSERVLGLLVPRFLLCNLDGFVVRNILDKRHVLFLKKIKYK